MSNDLAISIFLDNIMFLRKENGISLKKMAQIMKISVNTLRKIESGVLPKRLNAEVLLLLSDYFDISIDGLFIPVEASKQSAL